GKAARDSIYRLPAGDYGGPDGFGGGEVDRPPGGLYGYRGSGSRSAGGRTGGCRDGSGSGVGDHRTGGKEKDRDRSQAGGGSAAARPALRPLHRVDRRCRGTADAAQPGHADGGGGRRGCPPVGSEGCVDATGRFPALSSAAEAKTSAPLGRSHGEGDPGDGASTAADHPSGTRGGGGPGCASHLCGPAVSSDHDNDAGATG